MITKSYNIEYHRYIRQQTKTNFNTITLLETIPNGNLAISTKL